MSEAPCTPFIFLRASPNVIDFGAALRGKSFVNDLHTRPIAFYRDVVAEYLILHETIAPYTILRFLCCFFRFAKRLA